METQKTGDLHLHALDRYDCQNDPSAVVARLSEMHAKGFALTQHGTLAGIEDMRKAAAKAGLKFIPGIETYFGEQGDLMRNQHLVLLSADYAGYKAISMAATDSQNKEGYSVMRPEILRKYFGPGSAGHGHVIALSACIQGPLAAILRRNELVDRELEKITKRFKSVEDVSARLTLAQTSLDEINDKVSEAKEARDTAKKLAESKFAAREKRLEKLKAKEDPEAETEAAILAQDKEKAEKAKGEFETLKREVTALLRKQTIARQEVKDLSEQQSRYTEYRAAADRVNAKRASSEEMEKEAYAEARKFAEIFGKDNFYIEVQYHGIPKEREIYPVLARLARDLGLPIVGTNDVHLVFPTEEERLRRQLLRSLRFGESFEEESTGDAELYIKTDNELAAWLGQILPHDVVTEAIGNIGRIIDRCDVIFPEGEQHYPKFPTREGMTANKTLEEEIKKGIRWRFPDGLDEAHRQRLIHEVKVIESMGYADYHLVVKDFLEYGRVLSSFPEDMIESAPLTIEEARLWAENNNWRGGISVGPGRGSAVGSLVCYLLGITSMDPLRYGLLFERFLNPERVSMPDIDVDLSRMVRQKVIQYVQNKYGQNAVCGIMTATYQAPRGAARIAAKFYGYKTADDPNAFKNLGDAIAKAIPSEPGVSFAKVMPNGKSLYESLTETYTDNPHALEILRWSKILEGCFTGYGAHAAGIVISDNKDIKEYLPLRWNDKLKEWTTMCDMYTVEEKGLLKMDFLGLKTLDVITGAIRSVHKRTGKVIDPLEIPLDDPMVFQKIFSKGNTNSVFQFESDGMKSMLKRFQPESFDDLILLVAAFRPGPLQYLDGVIDVKTGKKPLTYATPELESILKVTYGYPIYQEQVMAIFQKLAGYTLGGADLVRRFMSKKKMDKLVKEREAFVHGDPSRNIDGCVKRGISEEVANSLFDQMSEFAKYAFNKSHAAAYALIAYWTGWFKCHYPAEFLAEAMNWADDNDKIIGLMRETKVFGVEVAAPDINRSQAEFTVQDGKILFGLGSVKAVGETGNMILRERNEGFQFDSLKDFFIRCQPKKDAVENLIKAGALDAFCHNRQSLLISVEPYKALTKKYLEKRKYVEDAETLLPYIDSIRSEEELAEKQRELGIAVLDKPTSSKKLQGRIDTARKARDEAERALGAIILSDDTQEDWNERLAAEHEMLGAYVTGHPLDEYDNDDVSATPIAEVDLNTNKVFGIISELKLKTRKKDGKPMAFLTVEDKTGSMEAAVFAAKYADSAKYLKLGNAVVITGSVKEEETLMTDENGLPVKVKKMYVEKMTAPAPARKLRMTVSSYAVFHVTEEPEFKKKYEDPEGAKCILFDKTLGQFRELTYRISESATELSYVY